MRIKRLVGISAIALGLIAVLVGAVPNLGWLPPTLMVIGWILMPLLLAYSLRHPAWRYLLAVPAAAVSIALLLVSIEFEGSAWATAGWWTMTTGVLLGGSLGTWFWYRWVPVPHQLSEPFSRGRWLLVGIHVGLIVSGWVLVFSFGSL